MSWHDIVSLVVMFISGVFMGFMDLNAHGKLGSKPDDTWRNKYKHPIKETKSRGQHWWYFGIYKPSFVEKFPFSSTLLVWMSDDWHKYKKVFFITLFAVISLRPTITQSGAVDAIILNITMLMGFNITYH